MDDEDDGPLVCACCDTEGVPTKLYDNGGRPGEKIALCYLCATSYAGSAVMYEHLSRDARMAGLVVNMTHRVLRAIRGEADPRLESFLGKDRTHE